MDEDSRLIWRRYQADPSEQNFRNLVNDKARTGKALIDPSSTLLTSPSILYVYCPIEMAANSYTLQKDSYFAIKNYYNSILKLCASFKGKVYILHNKTWLLEGLTANNRDPALTALNNEFFSKLASFQQGNPDKYVLGLIIYRYTLDTSILTLNYNLIDLAHPSLHSNIQKWVLDDLFENDSLNRNIYYAGGRLDRSLEFTRRCDIEIQDFLMNFPDHEIEERFLWKLSYGFAARGSNQETIYGYRATSDSRTHFLSNITGYTSGTDTLLSPQIFRGTITNNLNF